MKLKKIISRIKRKIIFLYDGVNTKKYMSKYNCWLKKQGMDLNGTVKYIHHSVFLDGVSYQDIHIGNNSVLSVDVIVLVHDFSIEAGMLAIGMGNSDNEARFLKPVHIGENCFIGARCTILPGCSIGNNCIVGAGTVLSGKAYPENSIIVGNPAKVVGNTQEWANRKILENSFTRGNIN